MRRVVLASDNPAKLAAVRSGFQRMFPDEPLAFEGVSVPSEVAEQPFSDEETLRGAFNRARNAARQKPQADIRVGVEGGVEEMGGGLAAFAWVVILAEGCSGKARTGAFFLPPAVAEWVRQGVALGEADDRVFGRNGSSRQNGAVGLLTGDVLDRAGLISEGVVLALIPFKNRDLYG